MAETIQILASGNATPGGDAIKSASDAAFYSAVEQACNHPDVVKEDSINSEALASALGDLSFASQPRQGIFVDVTKSIIVAVAEGGGGVLTGGVTMSMRATFDIEKLRQIMTDYGILETQEQAEEAQPEEEPAAEEEEEEPVTPPVPPPPTTVTHKINTLGNRLHIIIIISCDQINPDNGFDRAAL